MGFKAIITDLDGTLLLPDGSLGHFTRDVFGRLHKKNIEIYIATGRPLAGALMATKDLDFAPEIAVYNGTQLYHRFDNNYIHKYVLQEQVVSEVIFHLEEQNFDYFVFHNEVRYMRVGRHHKETEGLITFFNGVKIIDNPYHLPTQECARISFWAKEEEVKELRSQFSLLPEVHVESFPFTAIENFPQVDLQFVEVQFACAGKVEMLHWLQRTKGIEAKEVMFFGDQNNDMGLLKAAGYSYAMSNSFEACFPLANEVIGSNGQEAVAKKLEEIYL